MKKLISLALAFLTISCQQNTECQSLQYDSETIALFDNSKSDFLKNTKKTELSSEEIIKIDKILKAAILKYNINAEKKIPDLHKKYPEYKIDKNSVDIKLEEYKRQYVPYINSEGQKEVWIYCMINKRAHSNWKKEILFAAGGGDHYFEVTINLSNKTSRDFSINGPA